MKTLRRTLGALPLAGLAATALAFSATGASDVLTPHNVATLRSVGSAAISPDGRSIAFTRSVPRKPLVDEDGSSWSELYVWDLESGRQRPFITGEVEVRGVAWTPDGSGIAFLDKRGDDEHTSLYVLPVDGGEATRVFGLPESSISSYVFSPDGERLAVRSTAPKSKERKELEKKGFAQEVYEEDWRPTEVWVGRLDGSAEPRRLALEGSVYAVEWSPADDRLAVSIAPTALVDDSYMRQRVWVVDGSDGSVLARIENPGKLGEVLWSPDGTQIVMIAAADVNDPIAGRLMVAPASGGAPVEVRPGWKGKFEDIEFGQGGELKFLASQGVWSVLGEIELAPGSEPRLIRGPQGPILHSMSLARTAETGAFVADSPEHPRELFVMSHDAPTPRRLTDSNPWLKDVRLAKQEVVKFAARDGLDLEGLLVRPLDEAAGRRYPLILYVHGGPESHHTNGWVTSYSQPGQIAAARGYAVFYTNYRGSTGRGIEFAKLSQGDPAGKEFDDLVDAVDHLIEIGLVDGDKVGVTGGSYGGYATAWLSTFYSERFAAGVMFVGISNKISKVGTTDIPDEEFHVHARHRPWEDWEFFLERSPIKHADKSRTPLVILHGKDDPRVDPGQSRELYRHLELRGQAPVRLVLYPGEGHGNRKAGARLDYSLRLHRWMDHYLTGPGGEPPPIDVEYEAGESPGS